MDESGHLSSSHYITNISGDIKRVLVNLRFNHRPSDARA